MSMAFYKNAAMAHITGSRMLLRDDIEEALAKMLFRPLEKQQRLSEGFVSPVSVLPADELTYTINQCVFFAYRSDEKVIPKSAINQLVAAKAKEIEEKEQRKVCRKERKLLQEQVLDEVTPNALPKQSLLRGYFDLRQRMLVVDSTSPKKLEELHGHLRSNLFISNGGGIAFQPLNVNATMSTVMSCWLLEGYTPSNFSIDDEGEIIAAGGEGAQIKIAKQDMEASDITQLLQAGRVVRKLAMTWNDRIGFVVATGFNLSKLHWHEKVELRIAEAGSETAEDRRDASMTIMTGDLRELVYALGECFNGITLPEEDPKHPVAVDRTPVTDDGADPLYSDAADIVRKTGKASISSVQRHLRIGYNRAARLVEQMEVAGLVSSMDNAGNRTVFA